MGVLFGAFVENPHEHAAWLGDIGEARRSMVFMEDGGAEHGLREQSWRALFFAFA